MKTELGVEHLLDELRACSFAADSLLGILSELYDDDLSGYIRTLAELAERDLSEKLEALSCLVGEYIGEIKIKGGLSSANASVDGIREIRFTPNKALLDLMISGKCKPGWPIVIPVGPKGNVEKQGASAPHDGNLEAPEEKDVRTSGSDCTLKGSAEKGKEKRSAV